MRAMKSAKPDNKGLPWGSNRAFWYNLRDGGELFQFLSRWARSPLTLSYREKYGFAIRSDPYTKAEVERARRSVVLRTNASDFDV